MEWKSLIAGLVFTMGGYAIKCGIGLACGFVEHEKRGRRLVFTGGAVLAYTLLFGGSYLLLIQVNLLNQLLIVQRWVEWAMAVHLAMATLLFVWRGLVYVSDDSAKSPRVGRMLMPPAALPGANLLKRLPNRF